MSVRCSSYGRGGIWRTGCAPRGGEARAAEARGKHAKPMLAAPRRLPPSSPLLCLCVHLSLFYLGAGASRVPHGNRRYERIFRIEWILWCELAFTSAAFGFDDADGLGDFLSFVVSEEVVCELMPRGVIRFFLMDWYWWFSVFVEHGLFLNLTW